MPLTATDIELASQALFEAEKTGKQTGLLSIAHPGMDLDDAYAVQSALIELKLNDGRQQIGWKIGLTSKAMQQALGISIPDSGILFDDMLFTNGATIPANRFIQPRIEAEIAFVMKDDVSGMDATREQIVQAVDYVVPSLEILDTRILRSDPQTGTARKIVDTISDNAANAGIVLGDKRHAMNDCDLRWVGSIVSRNDEVEETGLGAGVLNDPVMGIVWLVQRLANYEQGLSAGDIVLSGSFIRPVEAPADSHISADFGDFGHVSCHFS